jgi:hypothetical protein
MDAEPKPDAATAGCTKAGAPRLLDRLRAAVRLRHYSFRTEECYVAWVRRFILFHGKRHPLEMGAAEINAFLTDLAVRGHVSASTQNQAFSAVLFLYQKVLMQRHSWFVGSGGTGFQPVYGNRTGWKPVPPINPCVTMH